MTRNAKRPLWRRILAGIGGTLLTVVLLAVFYVTVVLGQPQKDLEGGIAMDQTLLAPSPAMNVNAGQQLDEVIAAFPVPVLCCVQGNGMALLGGASYDTAFENGVARIATFTYADTQGREVQVTSIYPVRALPLIANEGWRLIGAGPSLAGNVSVRMEKEGLVRLHAQSMDGLYVVTTMQTDAEQLQELLRPLQLLGGTQAE